jgi:hypothetical protein
MTGLVRDDESIRRPVSQREAVMIVSQDDVRAISVPRLVPVASYTDEPLVCCQVWTILTAARLNPALALKQRCQAGSDYQCQKCYGCTEDDPFSHARLPLIAALTLWEWRELREISA